jgi:glutamate N-acetyltransferase/amino-acid N-acetyltransferase
MGDADRIGRAVVDSPLVKTAVHGADPNWGRITTAAGYSGAAIDPGKMTLSIGPAKGAVCVFRNGQPTPAGSKPPEKLRKLMKEPEVTFTLEIGKGKAQCEWLGCDLSREYIRINADYTT